MTDADEPLTDATAELHALLDGQLEPERVEAVLAHLRRHPDDAIRLAEWQAQRQALRRWHRGIDPGPTPSAMHALLRPRAPRRGWQAAAAVALLALGAWAGHGLHGRAGDDRAAAPLAEASTPAFARQAAIAHAVFTPETRHPVEVSAADEAHLVAWLGRRLGTPLKAPSLADAGFRLLGGRLLPGDGDGPRAQFMYEDAGGRRLTLYVARAGAPGGAGAETSFRSVREGGVESFYWIDGDFGYALAAQLPPGEVITLARSVYRQLARE